MNLSRSLIILFVFLVGCQQKVLYLYQQKVDPKYLASTNVGSPDPLTPPKGQMVVAEWWLPSGVIDTSPVLRIHVLFRNYSEDCVEYPIHSRVGSKTYWIVNKDFTETGGPLAYRAEIVSGDGELIAEWQHQLWVRLIDIEETSSAVDE